MRPSAFLGLTAALLVCAAASACGEEEATVRPRLNGTGTPDGGTTTAEGGALGCGVVIPTTYDGASFTVNAGAELALGTSLEGLDAKMASTEGDQTTTVTGTDLAALYNGGAPSLRSVSSTTVQGLVDTYLSDFGAAQGKTWQPSDAQADGGATTGGKFKGLFYESRVGTDMRAATAKALLGGSLYNHALGVMQQGMSDATVDKLLALFGATPAFANSTNVEAGANGDRFVAALASKRDDKSQPTGLYRRMRSSLLTMKAAVTNPACRADFDAALAQYRRGWEQATFASAIFALNAAAEQGLVPDSAPLALHSFGEALGLIQGFKGLPVDQRKISDAQIDGILTQIHADAPFTLITDAGTRKLDLTSAINTIAGIEEFDAGAIESFKKNF